MIDPRLAGAILTIDLDAIAANWRILRDRAAPSVCAAVVKADAYGLGADRVVPVLAAAGCRTFFVASAEEGLAVRALLDAAGAPEAPVYVLNGVPPGCEDLFSAHRLRPVLNSLAEVRIWAAWTRAHVAPSAAPAALHVDTGMSRLGLPDDELAALAADPADLHAFQLTLIVSHFASSEDPTHAMNTHQRDAFRKALAALPPAPSSLAASSGIFLGPDFRGDLVRPGISLYGGQPTNGATNPMRPVVRLDGKILQVRQIDRNQTVGYGCTYRSERSMRIATVAVGYADGFLRSHGNAGRGMVGGREVPIIGRVSMDLITVDVTDVDADRAVPGGTVQLIGPDMTIDAVAASAGTISYEILTSLGTRYHRVYVGGG